MKRICLIVSLLALTGCVSAREVDTEKAFAKCRSISDKNFRDACLSEALDDAERQRREADLDRERSVEESEQRELNRVIGGVKQD